MVENLKLTSKPEMFPLGTWLSMAAASSSVASWQNNLTQVFVELLLGLLFPWGQKHWRSNFIVSLASQLDEITFENSLPKQMNVRKNSKRPLTPSLIYGNHVAFFSEKAQKPQHNVLGKRWPPLPPPPLELFRKFIRLGRSPVPQGRIAKA